MSWVSGSTVCEGVLRAIDTFFTTPTTGVEDLEKKRLKMFKEIITVFENADCDTLYELLDDGHPGFDRAYRDMYPEEK